MKIKAYAIRKKNGKAEPFYYEKTVGKYEVLVRITYCGMARGDIQSINDDWGDTKFPLVPGHEIIGAIEETGEEVTGLKNGDRVGIGYQQAACFECEFCRQGNEQFCSKQKVIAVDCYGGLAEHIIVDSRFAFKLPSKLVSAKSVPLMSSGLTVYSGIAKAKLSDKSKVAVLGVGGLGHLAIQFLYKMGHTVSAFSHSPGKKEMINRLGAEYIDSSNKGSLSDYDKSFDFILSTLNVDFNPDTYLRMLKPTGKMCLVSQPPNRLSINAGLLYDYAQRTVYGSYIGSRKETMDMLAFSENNNIESVVDVMPFSRMNEAIEMIKKGNVSMRLVLENWK
ncbi:NAD(P)-dependent alcohol dehydrogenase [Prolixibacter sp. NT017]|uniref:NAD(P)-dependent alcohol dehydrogenase n=1 Tax=Prolixibacter sp. NT017 TaxID=2652390 RepID=UPI0012738C36|nr:NAD(P)-dependent alcohol dehydrogenase [Prolixibacter sp. NT017]GET25545.1 alcohol dehydrogenase [Prolixibacter sp. NT017]